MDENKAFEFYKVLRNEQISWLNLHREHAQHYLTFIAAVFAVTLGAVYQIKDNPWLLLATAIGPVVNILLCANASQVCDRFYQRFLEGITIEAKLETLLGFTSPRSGIGVSSESSMPFPQDQYILPERWLESRQYGTAAQFVETNMDGGANRLMRRVFRLLLIANIALAVAIVIISGLVFIDRI
jgi:hypothetical protein